MGELENKTLPLATVRKDTFRDQIYGSSVKDTLKA